MINDVLLRGGSHDENFQTQLDASREIMKHMEYDLLASVPQFLGCHTHRNPWEAIRDAEPGSFNPKDLVPFVGTEEFKNADMMPPDLPILRTSRGWFLLLNLAMVGRLAGRGSKIRNTTCTLMRILGRKFGLSMAQSIAKAL